MLTSDLSTSIQRRSAVPSAQITFSSTDFYALMDEEIESKLIPLILRNLEEFYAYDFKYSITAGQGSYSIPTRAIAGKLRDVQIISSTDADSIYPLARLDVSDLYASTSSNSKVLIKKNGFYLKGNNVVMYPTPTVTQNYLNLEHYIRPNLCVDPSVCGLISSINAGTNQITVVALPSNITTATPVDFVRVNSGFECTAIDQIITAVSTNTITLSATLPTSLAVGDYVCQAKQSCVVQVPQELLPLLSQYVVVRVLAAQGDGQALQAAISELTKLEENAMLLISPRVDGKPKRATNSRGMSRFV